MANIRAARRSGRIFRGGRMVRETLWGFIGPTNTNMGAASTAVLLNTLGASALAIRPFTIIRARGSMFLESDTITASEFYQASLGFAVVSEQAVAIGVTAIPTPQTDAGSDLWFVYESLQGRLRFATSAGFRDTGHLKDYDSRAMRKVEEGQDLVIVAETSSISLGATLGYTGRFLVKLH